MTATELLVHPLTFEPLVPVGTFRGRPIWPILGGSTPPAPATAGAGGEGGGGEGGGAPAGAPAGDGGEGEDEGGDVEKLKAALEKERTARRDAERKAKTGGAAQAELDRLKASQQTDAEKMLEQAKREASDSARAEVNRDRVLDKIEVHAAGIFTHPEDAQLHLRDRVDELIKDGKPDLDAIKAAVDELAKARADLTVAGAKTRGGADGGRQGGAGAEPAASLEEAVQRHLAAQNGK